MGIDIRQEKVMSLKEAAKFIPSVDGKRPHLSTIWRWATKGLNGVKLEHVRIGKRFCTSREAINRFVNRLAESDTQNLSLHSPRYPKITSQSPESRQTAIAEAERTLDNDGI